MSTPEGSDTSRIAIKFGTATSSTSRKGSRPLHSSSLGKRQRTSHGLGGGGSDSESGDDEDVHGRHERITAFGENGAELATGDKNIRPTKRSLPTIARQPNRDWRAEARTRQRPGRQRSTPATASRSDSTHRETEVPDKDKAIKWGLTVSKPASPPAKGEDSNNDGGEPRTKKADADVAATGGTPNGTDRGGGTDRDATKEDADGDSSDAAAAAAAAAAADEKEAVQALLGQTIADRTKTRLVIERAVDPVSEDDVFQRDFHDAPDASTLDDYEAMPVEEFGAALLRGMGWDGKERGPRVKQVVRRPNQLGLGAKALKGAEDLGGWNHKSGGSSSGSAARPQRPPRLHEYRREEEKRREKREERYRDSYKGERDRERDYGRDERHSGGGGGGGYHASSNSRHHSRHHR
ncbi:g-patch domain containing protein [Niveomyces insectorum RCEF 264]|uniref:Pre-mRNA-splicing factor n=1 Tax=Niveomyces insectorum RCEF 264 TaxID=1081102 RepID=A0A162IG33_9HYPO|nr:g-patch domain containing protein [Niveomyces insectorum RCEF 264]